MTSMWDCPPSCVMAGNPHGDNCRRVEFREAPVALDFRVEHDFAGGHVECPDCGWQGDLDATIAELIALAEHHIATEH